MMKITRTAGDGGIVKLQVEGRISREAVRELAASCEATLAQNPNVLVDVAGVQFVDPAGVRVLQRVTARGAVLVGCTGFLTESLRDRDTNADAEAAERAHDADILRRLRAGDDHAFELLVRRYGGRMIAAAMRILRNESDARDAVQEAFLSAFRAIDGFAGGSKLSTWLHRIVVNTALMRLRTRRRRPEESIDDLLPRFDEDGHWAESADRWETSSETLLERKEMRALVRRAIDRLPEAYRTVLLLRDVEELDTDEAAAELGITASAVKTRLHRARQALRTLLERELGVEAPPALEAEAS